jgi:hypothetical protein
MKAARAKVHWLWRDLRLVYVLLVWTAFASSLFIYFNGGITLRRAAPVAPPLVENDDEIYTGSVIVVPPRGDQCWQMMLDNRTGRMWENGYVNCYVAVSQLADSKRSGAISSIRMQSISTAFRGEGK